MEHVVFSKVARKCNEGSKRLSLSIVVDGHSHNNGIENVNLLCR